MSNFVKHILDMPIFCCALPGFCMFVMNSIRQMMQQIWELFVVVSSAFRWVGWSLLIQVCKYHPWRSCMCIMWGYCPKYLIGSTRGRFCIPRSCIELHIGLVLFNIYHGHPVRHTISTYQPYVLYLALHLTLLMLLSLLLLLLLLSLSLSISLSVYLLDVSVSRGFCWIHLGHQFAIGALRAQIASVGTDGSNRNLGILSIWGFFA